MKNIYFIVINLAMILVLLTAGCGGGDNPFAGPTGSVIGVVVDEGNGKGIEGVSVVCGQDSATTNLLGEFEIDKADAGTDTITATKAGYIGLGNDTAQVTVQANNTVNVGTLKLAKVNNGAVNLTNLTPIAFNDIRFDSATFNSLIYPNTVFGNTGMTDNDAVAVYFLNGRFVEFRTTVGINDNSPYASELYKFLFFVDDVKVFEVSRIRGETTKVTFDVNGAAELRLEIRCSNSATGRAGGYYAGFGDARLTVP